MITLKEGQVIPLDSQPVVSGVEVVDYDPSWPSLFRREKIRLLTAIGPWANGIEHVGATAVPDGNGRPSIDILVGLRLLADAEVFCLVALRGLGYRSVSNEGQELPGRFLFIKGSQFSQRAIYLHIVEKNGPYWRGAIGVRDYLRDHPERVRDYNQAKSGWIKESSERSHYEARKTAYLSHIQSEIGI